MIYSDHAPILLRPLPHISRESIFRIEHWWLSLRGFDNECSILWTSSEGLDWEARHKALGKGLQRWARSHPLPSNKLKDLEAQILAIQTIHPSLRDHTREAYLRAEYELTQKQLEIWWHQRSRVRWAQLGDRNTKFSHCSATERRRRNLIINLQHSDDTWTEGEQQTRALLVNYFKTLYQEKVPTSETKLMVQQAHLSLPQIPITAIEGLIKLSNTEEIYTTLCQMGLDRALGPDGITFRFLKTQWSVLGPSVVNLVVSVFMEGAIHGD
jgi:hypothetical protein